MRVKSLGVLAATALGAVVIAPVAVGQDESPVSTPGLSPGSAIVRAVDAEAQRQYLEWRQHRALLRTPARERARERSRAAFRHMPDDAAARLARQQFRSLVERPAAGPLSTGERADEYVNDFAARLKGAGPNGEDALALSTHPLQVADEEGVTTPVDISLVADGGGGWEPRNALEDYAIEADASLVFADGGLQVDPSGEATGGEPLGETMVFANSDVDTDTLVKPLLGGAEFLWQLRSAASPERLSLDMELPPGAALTDPDDDGVDVVLDGRVIATVGLPAAFDADGQAVPATAAVQGGRVVIDVAHRDRDVAYPLMVDPPVTARFNFAAAGADAYGYWGNYVHGAFDVWGGTSTYGAGLNIRSVGYPNRRPCAVVGPSGWPDRAGMYYTAPGNAHIYEMVNTLSRHILGEYAMCVKVGIAGPGVNGWEGPNGYTWGEGCAPYNSYPWTVRTPGNGGTPGNTFVFGVQAWNPNGGSATVPTAFHSYFANAEIRMIDPDAPGISSFGVPDGWTNGGAGTAVNVLAGDHSTGVRSINVSGPSGWSGNGVKLNPNCRYGPCSKQYSVSLPLSSFPEGARDVTVATSDPAGNSSGAQSKVVKVDRSAPVLALDGELPLVNGELLGGWDYPLQIVARDGDSSQAGTQRSGIKQVTVSVNGVTSYDTGAMSCSTGSCSHQATWVFRPGQHTPTGPQNLYEIVVTARDQLDQVASRTIRVYELESRVMSLDEGPEEDVEYVYAPCEPSTDDDNYCGELSDQNPVANEAEAEPPLGTLPDPSAQGLTASASLEARSGYGISDQKWEAFGDPRLQALGIRRARLIVPYDVMTVSGGQLTDAQLADETLVVGFDQPAKRRYLFTFKWLDQVVDQLGYEPLISFEKSVVNPSHLPTVSEYRDATRAFRAKVNGRYGFTASGRLAVRYYTAWNEPNTEAQPTVSNPSRAGRYWRNLNGQCDADALPCVVVAGDFIDTPDLFRVAGYDDADGDTEPEVDNQYFKRYRDGLGSDPRIWAIHAYRTAGQQQDPPATLRRFYDKTTGPIWLTEQGGLEAFGADPLVFPTDEGSRQTEAEAANDLRYLLETIVGREEWRRIRRFYYYQWIGDPICEREPAVERCWDSGLVDHTDNGEREVLRVFRAYLQP